MVFVHLVKKVHLEKRDLSRTDLDMLFLVTTLKDFFADHDVIARTLEGEKVGTWFDTGMCDLKQVTEDDPNSALLRVRFIGSRSQASANR
jgi:hypothetical protein